LLVLALRISNDSTLAYMGCRVHNSASAASCQRWAGVCALVALIAAVALAVSIPVYAEAASLQLLQDEIAKQEQQTGRSPFALLFRYVAHGMGRWNGSRFSPSTTICRDRAFRSSTCRARD
jgi:hypothetical protein